MPAACLPTGRTTTTPFAHTVRSAICRRQLTQSSQRPTCNGTGRCAMSRAPRPVPLHHRATQAQMTQGLYLSLDERLGSGHAEPPVLLRGRVIFQAVHMNHSLYSADRQTQDSWVSFCRDTYHYDGLRRGYFKVRAATGAAFHCGAA